MRQGGVDLLFAVDIEYVPAINADFLALIYIIQARVTVAGAQFAGIVGAEDGEDPRGIKLPFCGGGR